MMTRVVLTVLAALALRGASAGAQVARPAGGSLPAFRSDRELTAYLKSLSEARAHHYRRIAEEEERRRRAAASCKGSVRIGRRGRLAAAPGGVPTSGAVITGRVTTGSSEPLEAAQVIISSLSAGANSGADGRYRLDIPGDSLAKPRRLTLAARRIGFDARSHTLRVSAGDSVDVSFTLCAAALQLSEVVMTGVAAEAPAAQARVAEGARASADESVTNTQHAGVDEGGIVKLRGDYLVMLRRGRLFTVSMDDGDLRPISAVDAFAPGIDPSATWYDELLVAGDKVVVIGYSYQRGGTEVGVFRIDRDGALHYQSTYHLRSNDYYSSRNYASRLIGSKLIFYTPLYLQDGLEDPLAALPAVRKWRDGASERDFRRVAAAWRVYRPAREPSPSEQTALHSVTVCDLAARELECEATVVVGPPGRVFYVSPAAVYVWVSDWAHPDRERDARAMLYRMPLDGSAPSAVGVSGTPVDQFSFLESEDGFINVLVRAEAHGEAMWGSERAAGDVALMRVPVASFGDGSRAVPRWRYRALPSPVGYAFQNRFVGDHLLYGIGNGWGRPREDSSTVYAVRWRGGPVAALELPHGVDRIEAMGAGAVAIGTDGRDLHFSAVQLGDRPRLAQRFVLPDAAQGELRSHGFFYKPEGRGSGVLGLPVRGPGRPGYEHLFSSSASILFLRNDGRAFRELGELGSSGEGAVDDACRASCVDWYGNARPLFVRGRVFALLGYELVEGSIQAGRIREVRRVNYAPRAVAAVAR